MAHIRDLHKQTFPESRVAMVNLITCVMNGTHCCSGASLLYKIATTKSPLQKLSLVVLVRQNNERWRYGSDDQKK